MSSDGADAGLGDADDPLRQERENGLGPSEVHPERVKVSAVDADDGEAVEVEAVELGRVVDLDEHAEAELRGGVVEVVQLGRVERGGDEQHRVGAVGAGLGELVGAHDEVLAQQRQVDGLADGGEVVERALEVRRLGDHREAAAAATRYCCAMAAGSYSRPQLALGGARALDLGDERRSVGAAQGAGEAQRRRVEGRALLERRDGDARLPLGDERARVGEDLVEDGRGRVGHRVVGRRGDVVGEGDEGVERARGRRPRRCCRGRRRGTPRGRRTRPRRGARRPR